jgi:hypothetical protein
MVSGPGSFRIDGKSLEFRAEAFNIPNHVNPGNPTTTLSYPCFGRILSSVEPRIMQMALKFVF